MQDGRADHLRNVGRVMGGARVLQRTGGEADLVVHHDMDRALGREAPRLRHVEGFHHHALAREGGVAMDDHGHDPLPRLVAQAYLACAHGALDHRCHDLEVRGIEGQRQVQTPAGCLDVGGKTEVILHVAAAPVAAVPALELVGQLARRLAEDVHLHVQSAAVGHADHDLLQPAGAAPLHQRVQQRDQALRALQREALLPDVTVVQVALQALGGGQAFENGQARGMVEPEVTVHGLEALLQPALLRGGRKVHELRADAGTVRVLENGLDLVQASRVRSVQ
jgi:hypothetical protein